MMSNRPASRWPRWTGIWHDGALDRDRGPAQRSTVLSLHRTGDGHPLRQHHILDRSGGVHRVDHAGTCQGVLVVGHVDHVTLPHPRESAEGVPPVIVAERRSDSLTAPALGANVQQQPGGDRGSLHAATVLIPDQTGDRIRRRIGGESPNRLRSLLRRAHVHSTTGAGGADGDGSIRRRQRRLRGVRRSPHGLQHHGALVARIRVISHERPEPAGRRHRDHGDDQETLGSAINHCE